MTRSSRGDPSKGPGGGDPGEPGVRDGPNPEGEGGFNRVSSLGLNVPKFIKGLSTCLHIVQIASYDEFPSPQRSHKNE